MDLSKVLVQILRNQMDILRIMVFDHCKEFSDEELLLEVDKINNRTQEVIAEIEK